MAKLAVADDVEDDVLLEFHAVVERDLRRQHHGFRIIGIDVQDRCFDHLDDVRAVQGRACIARVRGGETDLVVDHDMHRAARMVATGLRQIQRFHDHALAGESGIAVHQDRQHLRALRVAAAIHAGLDGTFDHRVDDFQVRRVERQRQVDRAACGGDVRREALMVLHVAGRQVVAMLAFEFFEQFLWRLAQGVHQHVQAAAVGHADNDFLHAFFAGALDGFIHRGDEGFAAFQGEALLAHVAGVQIAFQAFSRGQAVEDVDFFLWGEIRGGADRFQFLLQPALFGRVGDVHEFGADRTRVGVAQIVEQIAQGGGLGAKIGIADVEHGVHVGIGETVEARFQFRDHRTFLALQRIQVGPVRAQVAVSGDQLRRGDALAAHFCIKGSGHCADRTCFCALGERGDDGGMRHVRLVAAIDCRHMLHGVEIGAPVVRYRTWVIEIRFVQIFHVRSIPTEQVGVGRKLLHHIAHLSSRFARLAG